MRGLNKSTTQDLEQAAASSSSIATETPPSDQQANPDENGNEFLVDLFVKSFEQGSNLMFGNDVP